MTSFMIWAPSLTRLRGPRRSVAHYQDTEADNQHSQPAQRGDHFSKHEVSQQGNHAISYRRGRLHIAVIRPRQHQHISREKGNQRSDAKPNRARCEHPGKEVERLSGRSQARRADSLHPLAEQYIAQGAKDHHQQDQQISFKVQTAGGLHARKEPSAQSRPFACTRAPTRGTNTTFPSEIINPCYLIFRIGPSSRLGSGPSGLIRIADFPPGPASPRALPAWFRI